MCSEHTHRAADSATCCAAAVAACRELLAHSAPLDAAEARWQARAVAEYRRGRAEGEALAELARAQGYAEAVADVKAADRAIVGYLAAESQAERARWSVRGEARGRATFGAPHPDDYRGGRAVWPELPEGDPRPTLRGVA